MLGPRRGVSGLEMRTKPQRPLEDRVVEAAEGVLAEQGYVSLIEVLTLVGYLAPVHVEDWRRGRFACLEELIFVNPDKVSNAISLFQAWARHRNLKPMETAYLARTVGPRAICDSARAATPTSSAFTGRITFPLRFPKRNRRSCERN